MIAENNFEEIAVLEGLKSHLSGITKENYLDYLVDPLEGICLEIKTYCHEKGVARNNNWSVYGIFKVFFRKWPLFSGDGMHPVPHPYFSGRGAYIQDYHLEEGGMWNPNTEYGQSRWKLLSHVITSLEELIVQMKADQTLTSKRFVAQEGL